MRGKQSTSDVRRNLGRLVASVGVRVREQSANRSARDGLWASTEPAMTSLRTIGPAPTAVQEASSPRKNWQNVLGTRRPIQSPLFHLSEALCITTTICSPHRAMDLDDFDAAVEQLPPDTQISLSAQSPKDAVAYVDAQWYTLVNRRGRWMDLIGDYAGSEPFVVDGECVPPH